jgi:hypothetical protein
MILEIFLVLIFIFVIRLDTSGFGSLLRRIVDRRAGATNAWRGKNTLSGIFVEVCELDSDISTDLCLKIRVDRR